MSQLNDLTREFMKMRNRYDWDMWETVDNMHRVLSACEWNLFSDKELTEKGVNINNTAAKYFAERKEIHRLLSNSIIEF